MRNSTEALANSEERFESLIAASSQIVWGTDGQGNVVVPQPSFQAYTGQNDRQVRDEGLTGAVHPDDISIALKAWRGAVADKKPSDFECRLRRWDGEYRSFAIRGIPMSNDDGSVREWVGTCTDLTDQRSAAELLRTCDNELRQAQKMEAIGRLAGGVAHDFNNLLAAILVTVDLARDHLAADHPAFNELDDIRTATLRGADLTRQLLAFGRQQVLSAEVLDLNEAVEESARLLRRVFGERVEVNVKLGECSGSVLVDKIQLHQVIINLGINARDAMPQGGVVTIETKAAELDAGYVERHPTARPGSYALLSVSDTGSGMDSHTLQHVFEPFFTTKEVGKGTGLGLSTVYGIVHRAGGHIWVYSEHGRGTTFKAFFPRATEQPDAPVQSHAPVSVRGGSESILIVEDDETLLKIMARALGHAGYRVFAAANGHEALALLATHRTEFALVVTDVMMPGMNGNELAMHVAELSPALPVLFLSGYADETVIRQGGMKRGSPFLEKPFTVDGFKAKVRMLLDQAAVSAPPAPGGVAA
jgi:two-component system cell cycle sensor histidine kinase/response regulator CckA